MSSPGAARRAAVPVSSARAEASRRNGARSRGPRTPEGKARSAQNALRHGLRAAKYVVLADEDAAEFEAFEAALAEELAPVGAMQSLLARRVAVAAWRLARADRIETELLEHKRYGDNLALALIRDGHGERTFPALLRYRGSAMAEFLRALRTLKALQAEAATIDVPAPTSTSPDRPEVRHNRRALASEPNEPEPAGAAAAKRRPDKPRPDRAARPKEPELSPTAADRGPAGTGGGTRLLASAGKTRSPAAAGASGGGAPGSRPPVPALPQGAGERSPSRT